MARVGKRSSREAPEQHGGGPSHTHLESAALQWTTHMGLRDGAELRIVRPPPSPSIPEAGAEYAHTHTHTDVLTSSHRSIYRL